MIPVTVCLAASHEQTETIIDRLHAAGIQEILVLLHHSGTINGDAKITPIAGLTQLNSPPRKSSAATGALTGAAVGGLATAAGLVVPFVWPIIFAVLPLTTAAGAALGAVAGLAIGRDTRKDEVRTAKDFGIPESRLPEYHRRLDAGDYLIAVHTDREEKCIQARDLFEEVGAQHIETFR